MDLLGTWGKRTQDWLGGVRRSLLGDDLPPAEKRAATVGTMGPSMASQMQGLDVAQRAAIKRGGVRDLLGDPGVQARATDVASNLDFTGTFGGVKAKTAPLHTLQRAENMAHAGTDPAAIWEKTGWFQGPDKQWRFEIDDSASQFSSKRMKEIAETDLLGSAGTVLKHPDLYAAYPNLEKAQVGVEVPQGAHGQWRGYGLDIAPNLRPSEQKSTMLHELQHGVQEKEGFAKGGSLEIGVELRDELLSKIRPLQDRINRIRMGQEKADSSVLYALENELKPLDKEYDKLTRESSFNLYRRLAGETEARAVQAREYLSPEQRRARPPWLDYDVPTEQQIVRGVR